jgi:hypothetical protein
MDVWQGCLAGARQHLRGWSANRKAERNKIKSATLHKLENLDKEEEMKKDCQNLWNERYQLEEVMEKIFQQEEIYWQQRSCERWLLAGDANTAYFHPCTNMRRRKARICSLEIEQGEITDSLEIQNHIVAFYKNLFGSSLHNGYQLSQDFWSVGERLNAADKEMLDRPFSEKDLELAMQSMRFDTAPGPNGFNVSFLKKMWYLIKKEMWKMVQDFNENKLDLKRLNYGVITLVPKVREANIIKQYRLIFLLNVDFKVFPKLLMDRMSPLADKVISENQSAFIKGRNILEGVVTLHEIVHELSKTGRQGVIFKIDFEKAYDKVRWDLVKEVLDRKGFPENWVKKTM